MTRHPLEFARDVVGARVSNVSSDWSGVFKLAVIVGASVAGYFVYRHVVVLASTASGALGSAKERLT